jgi:hypothetical protein
MREAQTPHEIASIACTASEALAPKFPPKENTLADNVHRVALHLSISYAHFRTRANMRTAPYGRIRNRLARVAMRAKYDESSRESTSSAR